MIFLRRTYGTVRGLAYHLTNPHEALALGLMRWTWTALEIWIWMRTGVGVVAGFRVGYSVFFFFFFQMLEFLQILPLVCR